MALSKNQIKRRREWIAALRSGKYTQGRSRLRTADNRFCCLGVACDLKNPKQWNVGFEGKYLYDFSTGMPPLSVMREFGMRYYSDGIDPREMAGKNDSGKWSFSEIADVIELFTEAGM